jgi:hypothetical protein
MSDKIKTIKNMLTECGLISEAQESNTAFEQADKEAHTFKKENDKSFKADRLDLEEILNNTGKKKKDYVRKVLKTINQMIDGKKDVETLIDVVKRGRK